jgi:hypothetical protein
VSFSGDCQPQDIVVSVNRLFVADDLISSLNYWFALATAAQSEVCFQMKRGTTFGCTS